MVGWLWWTWCNVAIAGPPPRPLRTLDDLVEDLGGTNAGDRLLAARELRRRMRTAVHRSESGDELSRLEALQDLQDADTKVAPACLSGLEVRNTARACADILGLLETSEAEAPLASLAATENPGHRRAARALGRIQAANVTP